MLTFILIDNQPIVQNGLLLILRNYYPAAHFISLTDTSELHQITFTGTPTVAILHTNNYDKISRQQLFRIKTQYPEVDIIMYDRNHVDNHVLTYLKTGVNGYLSPTSTPDDLYRCIETVLNGKRYMSEEVFQVLCEYIVEEGKASRRHRSKNSRIVLSPRQLEIAELLVQGMKTSSIAKHTGLKMSTISTVKTNIFKKMGVDNVMKLSEMLYSSVGVR